MFADELFVCPIDAEPVCCRRVIPRRPEDEFARHSSDSFISEIGCELTKGAWMQFLPSIGQHNDIARTYRNGIVEHRWLASAFREGQQANAWIAATFHNGFRGVCRTIRSDQHFPNAPGTVRMQDTFDFPRQHSCLIVSHHHHRESLICGSLLRSSRRAARQYPDQRRIAHIDIQ